MQAVSSTPGPWEKRHLRVQSEGNYVADCDVSYNFSDEEKHANARLIAAAPALLAALETIHEAGRMSDQPRAVYCSLIAQDALTAAGNREDIETRWSKGEEMFAIHEMDEEPTPITSLDMLNAYSPDQICTLIYALEQCLPYVDRVRAMSGGDGDLTALNARAALDAAKGGAQ